MSAHTPGPWPVPHFTRDEVNCNCTYVLAGEFYGGIAEVYVDNGKSIADGGNDCPKLEEAKANARLIAAAPELLDALEAACSLIIAEVADGAYTKQAKAARAAINKATGRTS